ncbi:hypothetical protein IKQ02_03565 [bacterium]|nr:hypothetical protein [bacterium]
MRNLKHKNVFILSRALFLTIIFSIIILPWNNYIFEKFFNNNIILIGLFYFVLYVVIYSILLIILLPLNYTVTDKYIEKRYKFLFFDRKTVSFFNNEKIIIRISTNFLLSLFYLEKLTIYTLDERRILAIYIEKDDSINIINDTLKVKTDSKKPFKKNEEFFRDSKVIESFVYDSIFTAILLTLIYNFIFGFIIDGIPRLLFIGFMFYTLVFIISLLYFTMHSSNLISKVDEHNIHMQKGLLFKNNYYLPKSKLDDVTIIGGPFANTLNSYTMMIVISKLRVVYIPMHRENIEKDLLIIINKTIRGKTILPLFLIYTLVSLIVTIPIMIFNIVGGISMFMLLLIITSIFNIDTYTIIDNERLIIKCKFIISLYRVMKYETIKRIKIERSFRGYRTITYSIYDKKFSQVTSLNDASELKQK